MYSTSKKQLQQRLLQLKNEIHWSASEIQNYSTTLINRELKTFEAELPKLNRKTVIMRFLF